MNSKKHKLPRRILAMLLAICMFVTMFPSAMFAVEGGNGQGTTSVTSTENGVTVNKYVTGNEQEGYELTLEAYASDQLTTTTAMTPLDIVLVLDVSGSMDQKFTGSTTQYEPIYGNDLNWWETYYIESGDGYRAVNYYRYEDAWGYYERDGRDYVFHEVSPKTSDNDSDNSHTQFYEVITVDGQSKLQALQSAVNSFIDSVETNASTNNVGHKISIVKFSGKEATWSGNDTYKDEGDIYNYSQIVKDLTDVRTGAEGLKQAVNSLTADGSTRADLGLKRAQAALASDQSEDKTKKVVIMFTDGEPNDFSGFDYEIAADAINKANELKKDDNVDIYTIGVFKDAKPEDTDGSFNKYMNAVSSNYPTATAYGTNGGRHQSAQLNISGEKQSSEYYFAANDAGSLNTVFSNIADQVTESSLEVYPDDESVLSDTLSQYFNFPEGLTADSQQIQVQYAKATDYNPDTKIFTFNTPGDLPSDAGKPTVTITTDGTITVTGFDYKTCAASYNKTTEAVTGGKLVVTFPIEVDENAVLDNPVEGNMYPTNVTTYDPEKDEKDNRAKLSYKSDEQAETNDDSTVLTESPAVPVDRNALEGNGTDVTVQVYVDGEKVNNPLKYVTLSRDTDDTSYRYYKVSDTNNDGILDFDFNYYTGEGGSDCVDIKVDVNNDDVYLLQGVRSYQDYGKAASDGGTGTKNVTPKADPNNEGTYTYTVDNVTHSEEPDKVECTIYLYTKYSVEYVYENGNAIEGEDDNDSNIYISGLNNIKSTTQNGPAEDAAAWMDWKTSDEYSTQIESFPTVPQNTDGWYLGKTDTVATEPFAAFDVTSDTADGEDADRVIEFVAKNKQQYTIEINYMQGDTDNPVPGQDAISRTQEAGSSYNITIGSEGKEDIPLIIQENEETQWIFDGFRDGKVPAFSGNLNDDINITAEYLIDENGPNNEPDGIPDVYQATVTYKVEGGIWSTGDSDPIEKVFDLREYDPTTYTWEVKEQKLGGTIPQGMKPSEGHADNGAWNTDINENTPVIGNVEYTFSFPTAESSLTVTKSVVKIGATDVTEVEPENYPVAKIGEKIVYKIVVENTGNVTISNIDVTDTWKADEEAFVPENAPILYKNEELSEAFDGTIESLAAGALPVELYASYEVTANDAGETLINTATATVDDPDGEGPTGTDEAPGVDVEDLYTLTYDATSGKFGSDKTASVNLASGKYKLWSDADGTIPTVDSEPISGPTYAGDEEDVVVFAYWSTTDPNEKIYSKEDTSIPIIAHSVNLTEDTTVYAIWGYDKNGNGDADITEKDTTLTYNANGGYFGDDPTAEGAGTASVELLPGTYPLWQDATVPAETELPKHASEGEGNEAVAVVFIGWTETAQGIYDADDTAPTVITDPVNVPEAGKTVYAAWGYDTNNNGTADVLEDFQLIYDANGGQFADDEKTAVVSDLIEGDDYAVWQGATIPKDDAGEAYELPKRTQDGKDLVLIGWTEDATRDAAGNIVEAAKIYSAGEAYPTLTTTVTVPDPDVEDSTSTTLYAVWGYDTNGDGTADAQQVFITPADITVYTGGQVYGGVSDAEGNIIESLEDEDGLPEPGYFITLPYDAQQWVNDKENNEATAADLSKYLTFTYSGPEEGTEGNTEREWGLVSQGNYDANRYVYSLTAGKVNGSENDTIPVHLTYFDDVNNNGVLDDDDKVLTDDDITMSETLASDRFKMTINAGLLDQSKIMAAFGVEGQESETDPKYSVVVGTGTLTVKSVTDVGTTTNAIVSDPNSVDTNVQTAVADNSVKYYVNDSEVQVPIDGDRVQLLVDSVSDNDGFNDQMGKHAIDLVDGNSDTHSYKLVYMDLVDTENGNTQVTLGDNDELTIYWPMPEDADENGEFHVVHYTSMDRTDVVTDLNNENQEQLDVTPETINNQTYLTFSVGSFSPFALVYETDNGGNQGGGGWTPDGDDDGPSGLNTEDHFSYVVGYAEDYRTGEATDNEDLWPVKPNNQITRAEVATIFYRLLEDEVRDEYDTTTNDFSDVTADSWYNQTVSTLARMGIVKGYEDGSFRPNAPITRAEFGAIATRFFAETGATYVPGTFTDVTGDEWYANAIQDAVNLGLIGGYPDGTVRPNNNITRAEACAIVNRTLGRVPDADHLLPEDVMKVWPDNNPTDWFYADMQEATNGHEYAWIEEDGHEIEEWTNLLDKDWTDR